jgi:hypothetical protein
MWSHFDFALVFAGLGYIGLWAFAAGDIASHLSPGLQLVGMAAAAVAMVRVAMLIRARHAKPQAPVVAAAPAPLRPVRRNSIMRRAPKRRPPVEPRSEFGLRKPGVWPKR